MSQFETRIEDEPILEPIRDSNTDSDENVNNNLSNENIGNGGVDIEAERQNLAEFFGGEASQVCDGNNGEVGDSNENVDIDLSNENIGNGGVDIDAERQKLAEFFGGEASEVCDGNNGEVGDSQNAECNHDGKFDGPDRISSAGDFACDANQTHETESSTETNAIVRRPEESEYEGREEHQESESPDLEMKLDNKTGADSTDTIVVKRLWTDDPTENRFEVENGSTSGIEQRELKEGFGSLHDDMKLYRRSMEGAQQKELMDSASAASDILDAGDTILQGSDRGPAIDEQAEDYIYQKIGRFPYTDSRASVEGWEEDPDERPTKS